MSVARLWRIDLEARLDSLFRKTASRYLFAIVTVTSTFALRLWLVPFT